MKPSAKAAMSALYGLVADAGSSVYDRGLFTPQRISGAKVLSVGNLRSGGMGKTPAAVMLARMLVEMGRRPAVLLRGYKGTMEQRGGLVSLGEGPLVDACAAGDEAFEIAVRTRGFQVRVGASRSRQALMAAADGADVMVLDDGFQHRRLARDLDAVMICPEDLDPATHRLPFGPLRESPAALSRAHLTMGLKRDWRGHPSPPEVLLEHAFECFVDERHRKIDAVPRKSAYVFCGIARPDRFLEIAKEQGVRSAGSHSFADHHRYSRRDLRRIEENALTAGASFLLTTEKDLARLGEMGRTISLPLRALRITSKVVCGKERLLEEISRRL